MSYQTIQFTSSKLPNDFDWKTYLEINDDVKKVHNNEESAKQHYLQDGIHQRRLYKTLHLPKDFDWEIYLGLNPDVYTVCKTKPAAIMHFEKHGHSENRKYTLQHGDINDDFHWEKYILKNPSLKSIKNKIEALCHYYKIGKKQNLSYEYDLPEPEKVPDDFDWRMYLELNGDIKPYYKDKESAEQHYLNEGKIQNRHYKVPESEIPEDFDWKTYLELNTDVKQVYPTENLAKVHFYITGKNEQRCYRFYHIPENFDWKVYLDLNSTITREYRVNEYTAKLHYDLFGHPQGLPYQTNFEHIPDDFDWKMYKKMNHDIADICTNEITSKCHYSEYGIYQARKYKKSKEDLEMEQSVQEYINHPFLFHKYLLGITSKTGSIPYKEIFVSKYKTTYKFISHLHCYNIDQFYGFYEPYLEQIKKYCDLLIITFSIGNSENIKKDDLFIVLQCENIGMDIGGKYVCNYYLKQKNIYYDSILFLHSKTDASLRKLYWEPLIHNLSEIKESLENESIGIYVPPLVYMGDYACVIYKDHFIEPKNITCKWNFGNSLYVNDLDRYYELNRQNYMFPEGNCFVCKKKIADGLYGNYKDYYLLNSNKTFDAVWVKSYYGGKKLKQIGPTVQDIFRFFKSYRSRPPLYPNNIAWGVGHRGHPDNMYEHVFERLVFKMTQKHKYKVKVMHHNDEPGFRRNLQVFNDKINELMV
jgi:hypothetical protein